MISMQDTEVGFGRTPIPPTLTNLTRPKAVRFLQRATFGGSPDDVDALMSMGIDAWFDEQFAATTNTTMLRRLQSGSSTWNAYWAGPLGDSDQLRKRVTYAMSQIFVSSRASGTFRVAHYNDLLEENCFGDFRTLLEVITRSPSMSRYLTFNRNKLANDKLGSVPDENYAREVMQLFTIGLWKLSPGGRRVRANGAFVPAYTDDDIAGLARVFTGIIDDDFGRNDRTAKLLPVTGDFARKFHSTEPKTFLGTTITAGTNLENSLSSALDTLTDHPNVGPFICKQLIQRLVTSNPPPRYVKRVAAVFDNDGDGNRGNLKAVIRAVLLDPVAWRRNTPETFGKIREPTLRFTIAARALNISSTSGARWRISDLTDNRTGLGQQPWMAPSVFNFYRPGYVPPQTDFVESSPWIEGESLVSPEMQIVNETSTIGWINFVSSFLRREPSVRLEYDDLTDLIKDRRIVTDAQANALIDELEGRLCPAGLLPATRDVVMRALKNSADENYREPGDPGGDSAGAKKIRTRTHEDRVIGAMTLILASTDFLWER